MCPISILSIRSNDTKVVSSWESNPTPHRKGSYVKSLLAPTGPSSQSNPTPQRKGPYVL